MSFQPKERLLLLLQVVSWFQCATSVNLECLASTLHLVAAAAKKPTIEADKEVDIASSFAPKHPTAASKLKVLTHKGDQIIAVTNEHSVKVAKFDTQSPEALINKAGIMPHAVSHCCSMVPLCD